MNRFLFTDRGASIKRICDVYLMFTAGTAGAIPAQPFTYGEFIDTVVLDSTGVISVHLQDAYVDCVEITGSVAQASPSTSTASRVTPDISTNVSDATDPKAVIRMLKADGTVADMAAGDIFRLHLALVH